MSKQVTKIELNGKIIGTKPLMLKDSLISIRDKIKEKVTVSYIFLNTDGKPVSKEEENSYLLEQISVDKILKLKSEENISGIDIILNDSKFCSVNCSMSESLSKVRILLSKNITQDFFFLDQTENIVPKNEENDYSVEDAINNEAIKIKTNDPLPATQVKDTKENKKIEKEK